MIRAAVVDDERLVRKGFMSLIDWAAFGVMMVGEAGDGKEALKLIETEAIDLLFVDISMPGMSGFELIRHIRQLHPHIHSVVLTCHHEFDYVQEALRIGAVDYIVKTLLEVENADETIGRIVDRLKWEENMRSGGSREGAGRLSAEKAIVYFPLDRNQGAEKLIPLPIVKNHPLIDLGELWLSPLRQRIGMEEARKEIRDRLGDAWLTVLLTEVRPVPFPELAALCSANLQQALFYHPEGHLPLATLPFKDLQAAAEAPAAKGDGGVLDQALDLAWSLVPAEWDRFFEQLSRQRPPYSSVLAFGQRLLQDWGPFLPDGEEQAALSKALLACHNMLAWRGWLRGFADLTARRMLELGFTREVMQCMFRSVRYMQANAGQKINQNEVAASIGMSRGYFSQCFARFAGIPFGESLRNMRLNQAKRLLLDTELPIWEVSSRSGFEDERYFSRLFREHVGSLPSEFRTRGGRER